MTGVRLGPTMRRVQPERAVRLLAAGLVTGLVTQYLAVGERAGLNVAVGIAMFVALSWAVRPARSRPKVADIAIPATALSFAALCAARTDAPLVALDISAAVALGLVWMLPLRGTPLLRLTVRRLLAELLALMRGVSSNLLSVYRVALPALAARGPRRSSPAVRYASGLFLALPFLIVFGALFSAADAVFQRTVHDLVDLAWLRDFARELPQRAAVATLVGWCATGALATSADPYRVRGGEDRLRPLLGVEPAIVALLAIDALFVAFVGLQLTYLFGGRDTLDAAGITYSAYARRGFFELVAVATLAGATLLGLDLVVRARGRAYVIAATALIALTGAVLGSSAMRMTLYQEAYGWTELRLYVYAAIAFLAIALATLAWAVVAGRMDHVATPLACAAIVVALAVNAIGPSGAVASKNIERFVDAASLTDDARRDLDIAYLMSLGDGAIPAIVERLPSLPERERSRIEAALRLAAKRSPSVGDWRSWSLDRMRATDVLAGR
jgi:hypothetical protein